MTQSSESAREEAKTTPPASGRFDRTSIILHWFTVLLIAVQFSSAWLREMVDHNSSFAATLLDTHRNTGVLILTVSMARLAAQLRLSAAVSRGHAETATNYRQGQRIRPLCAAPGPATHGSGFCSAVRRLTS